ncbi:MAG: hypothetical protein HAW67_07025 [Endozoicomonadaceae bacterium]|nr:hypothetical protein [Endozoicomonadaceae bacterium]
MSTKPSNPLADMQNSISSFKKPVRYNMPVKVGSYHINNDDPSKSYVKGFHFATKEPVKVFLHNKNPERVSLAGFEKLQPDTDKKFNYAVPENGVIMFEDCIHSGDNEYNAAWARAAVRSKKQSLVKLMTNVRVIQPDVKVDPTVVIEAFSAANSKSFHLKSTDNAKAVLALDSNLIEMLTPKFGEKGNGSIVALRILSGNPGETPFHINISPKKVQQANLSGEEALNEFKNSDIGELVYSNINGALNGKDYHVETIPGVRYFLAPSSKKPFLEKVAEDSPVATKLTPSSYLASISKLLNPKTIKEDDSGKKIQVNGDPKLIEMYLSTSQLEDGSRLLTHFVSEFSNSQKYDFNDMPTPLSIDLNKSKPMLEKQPTEQVSEDESILSDSHNVQTDEEVGLDIDPADMAALDEIGESLKR